MAATLAVDGPVEYAGTLKVIHGTMTLDSSYPTAGESLDLATLGLKRLDAIAFDSPSTYDLVWDGSNTAPKIRAFNVSTGWTDSTTGTASKTLAAGVGVYHHTFEIALAGITDADVLTSFLPGHKFKVLAFDFYTTVAVTTAAKASTINLEIGTTNLTGGVISLTSAACTPKGVKVAGTAVTAANTGSASAVISVEATSTTAFVEGSGFFDITIQNMDTADAFASLLVPEATSTADLSAIVGRFTAIGI